MERKLLLERAPGQDRLAVMEDGELTELMLRRDKDALHAPGTIIVGRVENVLPGMNAAFIDIGDAKNAYLSGDDCIYAKGERRIEKLLYSGKTILVQVTKEPGGTKGCRVSMKLTLPGRVAVLLPTGGGISISRKIESPEARALLRETAERALADSGMGAILRTAAESAPLERIAEELTALTAQWRDIHKRAGASTAPAILYAADDLCAAAARDLAGQPCEIVADGAALYDELLRAARVYGLEANATLCAWRESMPLFDAHRVDAKLDALLKRRVWLKSGGYLVIDETEAMTVIDVNTGKFTGKQSFADTVLKLNLEAAREIARQLRLRDLGGIIIVDFIDMEPEGQSALMDEMEILFARDRNPVTIHGFTSLGLLELSRKRVRMPLSKLLDHDCGECMATGRVPSHETTALRALREIWARRRQNEQARYRAIACRPVVDWMRTIIKENGEMSVSLTADDTMRAGEYRIEAEA